MAQKVRGECRGALLSGRTLLMWAKIWQSDKISAVDLVENWPLRSLKPGDFANHGHTLPLVGRQKFHFCRSVSSLSVTSFACRREASPEHPLEGGPLLKTHVARERLCGELDMHR